MPYFLIAAQHDADSPFNHSTDLDRVWRELTALDQAMRDAGVFVFSRGLEEPHASRTLIVSSDLTVTVREGAYQELEHWMAGMWLIECADIDAAQDWAKKAAATHRCDVELRPFQGHVSELL